MKKAAKKAVARVLAVTAVVVAVPVALVAGTILFWAVRPNRAQVDPAIVLETCDLVRDGTHNSNTDFVRLGDTYWLAYVSSPYHFGTTESRLHLQSAPSPAGPWSELSTFKAPNDDIRDPKLMVIGDTLFLFVLENRDFKAEPYRTVYTTSNDGGATWAEFQPLAGLDGWLFWRGLEIDGTVYATAYWWEHGRAVLLRSTDGHSWEIISTINEGERNDETEAVLLPDGRLLATARLEYDESWPDGALGDRRGSTLIAVSSPTDRKTNRRG